MQEGGNPISRASQVFEAWLREAGQSQYPEGLMGFCFVSRKPDVSRASSVHARNGFVGQRGGNRRRSCGLFVLCSFNSRLMVEGGLSA